MVCIAIQGKAEKILPLRSTVTNFMDLELHTKLELLFMRIYRVLWIKGPFYASTHDKTMFESKGGPPDMPEGKRGIADFAYQSLKEWITVHRDGHNNEMTNFINQARARHESFYNRLKTFGILSNTFRGSWDKREDHQMFFEGCAVLVQYDLENSHPLMET